MVAMPPKPLTVDIHVHLVGTAPENGCFIAPWFRKSIVPRFLRWQLGLRGIEDDVEADRLYLEKVVAWVREASVDRAVLLALDGRYDASGRLDREGTPILVANDYVLDVAARHKDLLLAAPSVNPLRADALDELARVKERGGVLLKWLPTSQGFDPMDPRCRPFYRKLVDLEMPLLSHTGHEHTIPVVDQALGHPSRLVAALEEGVTVIAAHCGASGIIHPAREDHFPAFLDLLPKYKNLHGDVSAIGSMIRFPYPAKLLARGPEVLSRLVYGSDFPVPVSPLAFAGQIGARPAYRLFRRPNPIDIHAELVRALGFPEEIFARGAEVLRLAPTPAPAAASAPTAAAAPAPAPAPIPA
jgi:predicted TIM-barrel fold metal-dependent hydrolase